MAGGRPTKYKKEFAEKLPDMFKGGESVAEVCAELGIWKETFYEWIKLYPEFSNSYKKGLQLSEAWWTKLGRAGSCGKATIQPTTWIFNMKNRFGWADKQEIGLNGNMGITIDSLTPEENEARIKELIQELGYGQKE